MFQFRNYKESFPAVSLLGPNYITVNMVSEVEDIGTLSARQLTEQITVSTTVNLALR